MQGKENKWKTKEGQERKPQENGRNEEEGKEKKKNWMEREGNEMEEMLRAENIKRKKGTHIKSTGRIVTIINGKLGRNKVKRSRCVLRSRRVGLLSRHQASEDNEKLVDEY
jgi:hypothetical protein